MGTETESPHQRFFAQTNEGDPRQVYAFDMRQDAPTIFFLARGGASEAVRRDTRAGLFSCPVPDCPCPTFKMVRAGTKRDHFVHEFDPGRDHLDVPPSFYVSRLVADRVVQEGYGVMFPARLATDVTADVLMWDAHGARIAIFVAATRLTLKTIKAQAEAARRFDASPRWVFSVPGPLAQVQDVEQHECSWLVARQERAIWVNPIEGLVLTQATGPERHSVLPTVTRVDEWELEGLGVGHLTPLLAPEDRPEPGWVWTADASGEEIEPPTERERTDALEALREGGFSGVLLVTDEDDLEASLADALAPAATVERVAIEGVTRDTLGDRLVVVFGCGDFVEQASARLPSYADDQSVAYMAFWPADVSRALWVIAQRAWV